MSVSNREVYGLVGECVRRERKAKGVNHMSK